MRGAGRGSLACIVVKLTIERMHLLVYMKAINGCLQSSIDSRLRYVGEKRIREAGPCLLSLPPTIAVKQPTLTETSGRFMRKLFRSIPSQLRVLGD